jgi:hypothetical protein
VFSAINVDSGKVVWQYKVKQPLIGGALLTAGNLVFMGEVMATTTRLMRGAAPACGSLISERV